MDEQIYNTTYQGCLAVVWAFLLLHRYFEGHKPIIRVDYNVLEWISNLMDATDKLAPWRHHLTEF